MAATFVEFLPWYKVYFKVHYPPSPDSVGLRGGGVRLCRQRLSRAILHLVPIGSYRTTSRTYPDKLLNNNVGIRTQGEVHSVEPAFSSHPAAVTPAGRSDPSRENFNSRRLHGSTETTEASSAWAAATDKGDDITSQHDQTDRGKKSNQRHSRLHGVPPTSVNSLVHIAYRQSDLEAMRLHQQQQNRIAAGGASSPLPTAEPGSREKEEEMEDEGTRNENEGSPGARNERAYTFENRQRRNGAETRRRLFSESSGFHMASTVESGVASARNESDPLASSLGCPSSPRVFQIGIAMDAGYFKVPWRIVLRIDQYL